MYLQTVHIRNFRGVTNASFTFGDGVNVIFGPNEAGKSTFLAAVSAAFFINADASSREAKSFRPWNSAADPSVRIRFMAQGAEYELEKTYLGEKKGRLTSATTGLDTTNKDRINEELARLMPLYTADGQSMRNTFWIEQQQLESTVQTLQKDANLRSVLQNIIFNTTGDIEEIKKFVRKQVKDLGIGTRGAAVKNPGPVARAEAEVQRLREERDRMVRELVLIDDEMQRRRSIGQRIEELRKQLDDDRTVLEARKKYTEAYKRQEEANKALDDIIETITNYERSRDAVSTLQRQVRDFEEQQKREDQILDVLRRSEQIPQLEDTIRRGQEILTDVREYDRQIAGIIRQEAGGKSVDAKDITAARQLEQTVMRKRDALAAAQIAVDIKAFQSLEVKADADTKTLRSSALGAGGSETYRANQHLRLTLDTIAEITITSGVTNAMQLQYELEDAERSLTAILRKYDADSFESLSVRFDRQQQFVAERERLERERTGRLGKLTVERIEAGIKKYEADIEVLKRESTSLSLPPGETVASRQEKHTELVRQHTEAVLELRRCGEAVQKFMQRYQTPAEAQEQRRLLGREAAKAEAVLEELPRMDIADSDLLRIRQRYEDNEREHQALQNEYHILSGRLQRADVSTDMLHLKEAELEEAELQHRQYVLEFEAYKVIDIAIDETEQEVAERLTEPVEKIATSVLPLLTSGRYSGITLDKDLRITGIRYEGLDVRPEELSTGAQGQLALAIRLALIHHMAGNERQTVIIDDALVHFDATRLEEAKKLLTRSARKHQVIYLSCHEQLSNWPGALVHTVERMQAQ